MLMQFNDSISAVKGIGEKKAKRLQKLGIKKIKHFLFLFPKRYLNLGSLKPLNQIEIGKKQLVSGKITNLTIFRTPKKRMTILEGLLKDKTSSLLFRFFNQPYLYKALKDKEVFFYGKIDSKAGVLNLTNPQYEIKIHNSKEKFLPIYPEVGGLSSKQVRFFIRQLFSRIREFPQILPINICQNFNLYSLEFALKTLHRPFSLQALAKAKKTWAILELLSFISQIRILKQKRKKEIGFKIIKKDLKKYIRALPFLLTKDQKKSLQEIIKDLQNTMPCSRLLNGDVGSGKTIIAFLAMINAVLNKKQAVLMAPTEILAYQHFLNFHRFFNLRAKRAEFKTLLLTNIWQLKNSNQRIISLKTAEIFRALQKADIIFGTHALLEEKIKIPNLALVVIDEQQRFGVKQRALLRHKNIGQKIPHLLMLTATPIPRTLALIIFQDLKISFLKSVPIKREVKTKIFIEKERRKVYQKIKQELKNKHRVFVICPIIQKKEELDFDNRKAAEEEYKKIKKVFSNFQVGLLHGKMKPKEKEKAIEAFKKGETQILVSTSVVEVGIDIPQATVLLVEIAERFGLSQLHQLRGRIGRGGDKAFCFFIASSKNASQKLKILEKTKDGFKISLTDLKQRGPGEILGEKQHGFLKFRFASLFDSNLFKIAQEIIVQNKNNPNFFKNLVLLR